MKKLPYEIKKVTISLKESLDKKVRKYQTQVIMKTGKGCSYSKAAADLMEKGLK